MSILANTFATPQPPSPAEVPWSQRLGLPFPVALSVVISAPVAVPEPAFLHGQELDAWQALRGRASAKRQHEWLMGRLAVKRAAREWVRGAGQDGLDPWTCLVCATPSGRPVLCPGAPGDGEVPSISIAHLPEVVVGLAGPPARSLGIDIERYGRIRLDRDGFAGVAFTDEEIRLLGADWQRDALTLWAAKEAASKALGTGLEGRPRRFRVLPGTGDLPWTVRCGDVDTHVRTAWFGAYVVAVAWIP